MYGSVWGYPHTYLYPTKEIAVNITGYLSDTTEFLNSLNHSDTAIVQKTFSDATATNRPRYLIIKLPSGREFSIYVGNALPVYRVEYFGLQAASSSTYPPGTDSTAEQVLNYTVSQVYGLVKDLDVDVGVITDASVEGPLDILVTSVFTALGEYIVNNNVLVNGETLKPCVALVVISDTFTKDIKGAETLVQITDVKFSCNLLDNGAQ